MVNDAMQLIRELEVIHSVLIPDSDLIKLKIRYEEVLNNYEIDKRTPSDLSEDLMGNIDLYIFSKRIEGLSELTLDDYYRELVLMDYTIHKPTVLITTADIRSYLATNKTNMTSTTGKKLSVIKSFFAWLVDEEIILKNPATRIKQVKQPNRLPKALTSLELEMIREECYSFRERALVEVMYSTGCRLSEVSNMKWTGVDWVNSSITVIGKGDKERIVYLSPKAIFHLSRYLEYCEDNESECEFIFTTERRPYRQMKNKTIQDAIDKIASRTDIEKNVTPHVFRHTFATLAIENGIELGDLQQLLGHSNPSTTLRYISVSENRKHSAHKKFVR